MSSNTGAGDNEDFGFAGFPFEAFGMGGGMPFNPFQHASSSTSRPSKRPSTRTNKVTSKELAISLQDLMRGGDKTFLVSIRTSKGTEKRSMTINVVPGWKEGTKLKYPGAGDLLTNGEETDLEFVVKEKVHEHFKRVGNDLEMTLEVTLIEAYRGFERRIKMLDGREVGVRGGKVQNGETIRVNGEGWRWKSETGDLLLKIFVKLPTLDAKEVDDLARIISNHNRFV